MLFNCAWSVFHTSTFYALYVYWPLQLISFCAVVGNTEVISFDKSGHQYIFVTFNIHFYEVLCTQKMTCGDHAFLPVHLSVCLWQHQLGVLYIELSSTCEFCENSPRSNHPLLRVGKCISTCTFDISGLILVKFDICNVDTMPLSSCELRENRCSESYTSLMDVNEIVSVFLHFSLKLM